MVWIVFFALLSVIIILTVVAACRLELERSTSARFLAGSLFLAVAFVLAATSTVMSIPELLGNRPMRDLRDNEIGRWANEPELTNGQIFGILSSLAAAVGLFVVVLACVRLAQTQQPRQGAAGANESDEEMDEFSDITRPRDDHDR